MSCFIYIDLISSLLDPKVVDPGSTLVHTFKRIDFSKMFMQNQPF